MKSEVRVRFAPSPTGYLHIGGLRTALYNYLYAKRHAGKFILRIEDTDRSRFVEGAVEKLVASLKWIGLNHDEGPEIDGPYGPYFQSERLKLYNYHIKELLEQKKAYYCFCSSERLEALREEQKRQKLPQAKYDKHCLKLSEEEIKEKLHNNVPHVIRMNVPPNQTVRFKDHIRGNVDFNTSNIDDQVLIKSDGFPTYHLANVIDDHLMKISHVIRGEEWLSSTPKHVLLYNYFGWNIPEFAHLPLLLNPDKSKLSKRQGDVAVEDYRDKGYLKEALINFVALLGWNFGDDKEFYKIDEMIEKFSLDRVNKSGAVFNIEKLDWLNGLHIRNLPNEDLLKLFKDELAKSKYADEDFSDQLLFSIIEAMKERITFIHDLIDNSSYFFERPSSYDPAIVKKRWKDDSAELLTQYRIELESSSDHDNKELFERLLKYVAEKNECGVGRIIHPLRLAVSGVGVGPGVYDLLAILGRKEVIERISIALIKIQKQIEND